VVVSRRRLAVWAAVVVAVGLLAVADATGGPVVQAAAAVLPGVPAVLVGLARLSQRPRAQRPAWVAQTAGLAVITCGYAFFHLSLLMGAAPGYPLPADLFFAVGGFLVVASGVLFNRRTRDWPATGDAVIAVTGMTVAVLAVLVRPTLADDPATATVVLTLLYPALDLVNLGLVLRLWLAGRAPTGPTALMAAAFGCLLFGDSVFGALVVVVGIDLQPWLGLPFQVALVLLALAIGHPRSDEIGTGLGRTRSWSHAHWLVIGGASSVPALVLLAQGISGVEVDWLVTGLGALVLALLCVSRVHHAVVRVQRQADALASQARTDELTRLPNRRSWDAELRRACEGEGPVAVALLDLDHFKRLNDTEGHPAGDRVLRAVAAAWSARLPAGAFLARHGGEEFALLLRDTAGAHELAETLRRACPGPQTVSIGLVHRGPGEDPGVLMGRVDAELYRAKAAGRDRVCAADRVI
jgi:diguanylate cyclase (GGDEF)-like protein